MKKKFLITGGNGFIGSNLIKHLITYPDYFICNIDKLTYASNLLSLKSIKKNSNYLFIKSDICNLKKLKKIVTNFKPNVIIHLAAETHVDRSIVSSKEFIYSNIIGTFNLLEAANCYFQDLSKKKKSLFHLHHVSTDEVYGELSKIKDNAHENFRYNPSSPYSASKASSDHLVRSWNKTYGLPIIITNCSNNYGPFQFPEKFIPKIITNACNGKQIPIYGDGNQSRDWLFVEDHVKALMKVTKNGIIGETYNIGGKNELKNIKVAETICDMLEDLNVDKPQNISTFKVLITLVKDRPGHDKRYALDTKKIENKLSWFPSEKFETGLRKTVKWYLKNRSWWESSKIN